jgi:hypothetical protein
MNGNYERKYRKAYIYVIANIISVGVMTAVNMLDNSILNLLTYVTIVFICSLALYYESDNRKRRILECEVLALCLGVCESFGVMILQWMLQLFDVNIDDVVIIHCLEVVFSKVILIFIYYMAINFFMKKRNFSLSKAQYVVYFIMLVYNIINIFLIVAEFTRREANYLWVANMGCIVLADLYLLHYVKTLSEKSFYENQAKALEQQANIQYSYYLLESERYNNTLKVLHDVNKHIKMIEDLYETNQGKAAAEYTSHINDILKPLIPVQYSGNPILDILLTDKDMDMKDKGIDFNVYIDNVDMNHIEPIDITTIFGNLLDNAIEAAEKTDGNKFVCVRIGSYHQMISIRIENSSNYVKWKNGTPVSEKGENRGLGILNVRRSISKYDGDIKLNWANGIFTAEMFLNT